MSGVSLTYGGRTHFRTTRGTLLFLVVLSAIVLLISIVSTVQDTELWVRATCWAIFLSSVVGVVELLSAYVTLDETHFRMRKNFRKTVLPRESIQSVEVAKGCPIMLILKDGGSVTVPELGGQGIDNSLRAWIKAT